MDLCSYKNIFGESHKGLHQFRFFGFALIDIIGTIIAAGFISYVTDISFLIILLILFIIGQLLHYIFCVDTEFIKLIK